MRMPDWTTILPAEVLARAEELPATVTDRRPLPPVAVPPAVKLLRAGFRTLGPLAPGKAADLAIDIFRRPTRRSVHKRTDALLDQAYTSNQMFEGETVRRYRWGTGGPKVLLAHGWESRGTALRRFAPGLVERGFEIHTFDAPAHGDSTGNRTDMPQFARLIQLILEKEGPFHGVIAHSLSCAATAYAIGLLNPDLPLNRLAMMGAPENIERIIDDAIRMIGLPQSIARRFIARIEDMVGHPLKEGNVSRTARIARVEKILFVHDREDPISPFEEALDNLKGLPNARLLVTHGLGHHRALKDPVIEARVRSFIAEEV